MSFDLQKLKDKLNTYGKIEFIDNTDKIEFIVFEIKYMLVLDDFNLVVKNDILPYYPNLRIMSLDTNRLKCCFNI
jgi:hypothetical protein